jgi:hypothetical protein
MGGAPPDNATQLKNKAFANSIAEPCNKSMEKSCAKNNVDFITDFNPKKVEEQRSVFRRVKDVTRDKVNTKEETKEVDQYK